MQFALYSTIATLALTTLLAGCAAADGSASTNLAEDEPSEEVASAGEALLGACTGDTCNGLDPSATGCEADATTRAYVDLYSGGAAIGRVAVRYSPSCRAAWTRVSTNFPSRLRAEVYRASPLYSGAAQSPVATTALRSPMVGVASGTRITSTGRTGEGASASVFVNF